MKMAVRSAFALLLLAMPGTAFAQYMTGYDLLTACASKETSRVYNCMNYVAGVIDYHIVMQSLGTTPTTDFCLPREVSIEEATVTVMTYLENAPQHQAFIAAPAVTMALHESFPCAAPKARKKR